MNRAKSHVRVECMISEVWEQLTGEGEGELAKSHEWIEPEQMSMARKRTKISVLLFASRCIFMTLTIALEEQEFSSQIDYMLVYECKHFGFV